MSATNSQPNSEISLTYKYLLTFSTLSAVCFCWLYITKPTEIIYYSSEQNENNNVTDTVKKAPQNISSESSSTEAFNLRKANKLPGDSAILDAMPKDSASTNESDIPLAENASTENSIGFEETNDRIQHIITAKSDSISERIIIEIPVIYKTRGLKLGPEQAKEAQRVLKILKIFQAQIKKLHLDGKNIQLAWDNLLMQSQPVTSLRADSPSLPQNMSNHSLVLPDKSSKTIKQINQ